MANQFETPATPIGTSMTLAGLFTFQETRKRDRIVMQVQNLGPGNITDFRISWAATIYSDNPWEHYIGSSDFAVDSNGNLTNSNTFYCSNGWPTIASGTTMAISVADLGFAQMKIELVADTANTLARIFFGG